MIFIAGDESFTQGRVDYLSSCQMAVGIEQLLNTSRMELIDLSTRNRLLSIPVHSKSTRLVHLLLSQYPVEHRQGYELHHAVLPHANGGLLGTGRLDLLLPLPGSGSVALRGGATHLLRDLGHGTGIDPFGIVSCHVGDQSQCLNKALFADGGERPTVHLMGCEALGDLRYHTRHDHTPSDRSRS